MLRSTSLRLSHLTPLRSLLRKQLLPAKSTSPFFAFSTLTSSSPFSSPQSSTYDRTNRSPTQRLPHLNIHQTTSIATMSTTSAASVTISQQDAALVPEERSFQLRNGLVIRAKHWRSAGPEVTPRDCRRFIAFHGYLDNAGSFDP